MATGRPILVCVRSTQTLGIGARFGLIEVGYSAVRSSRGVEPCDFSSRAPDEPVERVQRARSPMAPTSTSFRIEPICCQKRVVASKEHARLICADT
jgi:hypothetical protein